MRVMLTAMALLGACSERGAKDAGNAAAPAATVAAEGPAARVVRDAPTAPPPAPLAPAAPPAPAVPKFDANAVAASEKTPAAAQKLLGDYFAALAARHYGEAYRMWGGKGAASGTSEGQFAAGFAKYKIYDGRAFGPGESDGAAGSIFIQFPVTVTGILARGGGFSLSGSMTLRRVNDVDGSSPEQRRWHIAASELKPGP